MRLTEGLGSQHVIITDSRVWLFYYLFFFVCATEIGRESQGANSWFMLVYQCLMAGPLIQHLLLSNTLICS